MNKLIIHFARTTNPVVASVLNSLWEGVAMTLLVWLLLKVFRRLNSATRYAIWCVLLAAVTTLTCANVVNGLQTSRVIKPQAQQDGNPAAERPFVASFDSGPVEASASAPGGEPKVGSPALGASQSANRSLQFPNRLRVLNVTGNWSVFVAVGWALVSMVMLGRVSASYFHLKKLKRTATPLDDPCRERFQRMLTVGKITRSIRVGSSAQVSVPVALGLLDPFILLPDKLPELLEESELDQILLHEAAHLSRGDDWSNLVQQVLIAVFPFHPAVHWISRQLNTEREIACDDWVTTVTGKTKRYALCLTKLAELTRLETHQILASGAWISKTQLNRRIVMLLDQKQNRTNRVSTAACAACLLGLGGLLFVFSRSGQLVAAENNAPAAEHAPVAGAAPDLPSSPSIELPAADPTAARAGFGGARAGGFGGGYVNATGQSVAFERGGGGGYGGGVAINDIPRNKRHSIAPQTDEERQRSAQLREKVSASLRETLNNETNTVLRVMAMNSLVEMRPDKAVDLLVGIVTKDTDSEVRRIALTDLAHQRGNTSTEALLKLYDQLEDVEFKTVILRGLGSRQTGNVSGDNYALAEKWIAKLQQIARESPSRELRLEAIQQLGLVGRNLQDPPNGN
jgi:beta-lactamase regulating signal transducer with metallopeptidase domain